MDTRPPNGYFPAVQFRIARPTDKIALIEQFYVNILGLTRVGGFDDHDGYRGIMIGLPGYTYHLEFTQDPHHTPCPAPTKDNLLVFYFETPSELDIVKQRLADAGIEEVDPENPYWLDKSHTYEDPDGWRIVLFNGLYG